MIFDKESKSDFFFVSTCVCVSGGGGGGVAGGGSREGGVQQSHSLQLGILIKPAIAAMHGPHSLVRIGPGYAGHT